MGVHQRHRDRRSRASMMRHGERRPTGCSDSPPSHCDVCESIEVPEDRGRRQREAVDNAGACGACGARSEVLEQSYPKAFKRHDQRRKRRAAAALSCSYTCTAHGTPPLAFQRIHTDTGVPCNVEVPQPEIFAFDQCERRWIGFLPGHLPCELYGPL